PVAMEAAAGWRYRPGGRLDMSHGFVRHIRRNQLARDAYERALRQARGRARLPVTPPRPRRPDQPVGCYGSRGAMGLGVLWVSGGAMELSGCYGSRWVLWVTLGAMGLSVSQGDSAEDVTQRVCARSPLEPPLRRALCQRVQDELRQRRGTG
ncbi:CB068 protein, partial [Eolophus roseicapillus]|nr:CB068 protein [Eolophus roseicapilla]